jgi:hypothetical protein
MYLIKETKEDPRKLEFVSLSLIFHLRIEQRCSLVFFPCQSTGCASTATPSSTSSRRIRLSKTTFSRYVIYLLSLPSVENAADRSSRSSLSSFRRSSSTPSTKTLGQSMRLSPRRSSGRTGENSLFSTYFYISFDEYSPLIVCLPFPVWSVRWHQLCHSWTHYAFVVPFMMFLNGTRGITYAAAW